MVAHDWAEITPRLTAANDAKTLFGEMVLDFFIANRSNTVREACLADLEFLADSNRIPKEDFISAKHSFLNRLDEFERLETGDKNGLLSCFKKLSDFAEEEATWLVPGWIPEGQITLMAADGGIGKTTLWCNLIAAISSGSECILDPPGFKRVPQLVAFLTTEDSVRKKLCKKLRLAGANMRNIITPDFSGDADALKQLKFGSTGIAEFVRYFRPALVVFDPVQGFIPPDINMGSRNAMRDCMAPLIALGEETGTTFLVVCHTNKRKMASGRDRVADSADLWDISRSVLMAGYTEDQGIRYLSNEKNNYDQLQETLLFSIDSNGIVHNEGRTWKRDREYAQDAAQNISAPKREDCKAWILNELEQGGGSLPVKTIEEKAMTAGYSYSTLRRAKDGLSQNGEIKYLQVYNGTKRVWNMVRSCSNEQELL